MQAEQITSGNRLEGSLPPSNPSRIDSAGLGKSIRPGSQFDVKVPTLPHLNEQRSQPVPAPKPTQPNLSADSPSPADATKPQQYKLQKQSMTAPAASLPQASQMPVSPARTGPPRAQSKASSTNPQKSTSAKSKPEAQVKAKKKGGIFSFWTNRSTPKKEMAAMRESHEKMANMMRDMCEIIEKSGARQAKIIEERVLEPFPLIAMDAINKSQEKVHGTLTSLDTHMARANARETQVLETLNEVKSLGGRSNTVLGEVSTAMDGVQTSMDGVQTEMGKSSETFEKLYSKMERAEQKFSKSMLRMQRRSLWINCILGLGVITTLGAVAYLLYQLSESGGILNLAI